MSLQSASTRPELRNTAQVADPSLYRVILLNDDATPMDFVVALLMEVFGHEYAAARDIMFCVHRKGSGAAGTYPLEIAEAKAIDTVVISRHHGYPLRCHTESERL